MSIDFYGSGMAYPLQVDTAGGIRTATNVEKIEEAIRISWAPNLTSGSCVPRSAAT